MVLDGRVPVSGITGSDVTNPAGTRHRCPSGHHADGRLARERHLLHPLRPARVQAEFITLITEHSVLTVRAERLPAKADGTEMLVAERPYGAFSRQVILGEALDTEHIAAVYTAGVLTLTIPVRESAQPHSIRVTSHDETQPVTAGPGA